MADNQIKISVNLDSKELDQKFSGIIKKLQAIREEAAKAGAAVDKATGGTGSGQSRAGGGAGQAVNANQSNKSLEALQKTLSSVSDRTDTFNKNLSILSKTLDDLSNKAQAAATSTTQATTAQKQAATTQQQAATTQQQAAGGGGVGGGAGGGGGGIGPFRGRFDIPYAKIAGLAGTAVIAGGQLYKQAMTYPERIAQREASMADMMSESARLQQQRRGYEMSLFGPERARALERANTRVGAEKVSDATSLLGTVGLGAATGGALGLKAGATIGAGFGMGFGAIPGAIIGGTLGVLGGGAMAFGGNMLNDRKRSMLFDREGYQKEMGAVFAGTYKEQLAAERAKSYQKDLAAQFLEKESGRFRTLQRGFGLSDEELFMGDKSIFGRLTGSGQRYEMEDITEAMQGISAAGGTKGIATGEGLQMALQMQRNLGLTNAPQLMGRISGVTGMGAEGSREQIFRMFAEASRAKLELPQARQFTEAAAEIGYKTGGDFDTITRLLSAGVQGTGLRSSKGIESAQLAFEQFRQRTGETGGLTGQYKLASLFSKKLGLKEANYISELPIEQISEKDPVIKKILAERNRQREIDPKTGKFKEPELTVDDLRKEMTSSTFRTSVSEGAAKEFATSKETYEKDKTEENKKLMEEKYAEYALQRGMEIKLPQEEDRKKAYLGLEAAAISGKGFKEAEAEKKKIEEKYKTTPTTLEAQKAISGASDAESQLYNLSEEASKLKTAFSENEGLGKEVKAAAAGLQQLATLLEEITDPDKRAKVREGIDNIQKMVGKQSTGGSNMSVNTNNYSSNKP